MSRLTVRFDRGYVALSSVIFAAAAAPIFIRFAQTEGVPSLSIIFIRLLLTSLILSPFIFRSARLELRALTRKDWFWVLLAGGMHAVNLSLLFFSLELTSVLVNSVLRQTTPLWVIWFEILFLHAVFARRVWLGVVLTVVGSTLVGLGGAGGVGGHPLLGGGLALVNAFTNSLYLIIGRKIRDHLSFLTYSWIVFFGAALVTGLLLLGTHTSLLGYSFLGYFWVIIITIIAQFLGHIPINAALHRFSATRVSLTLQLSVAVAGLFAFMFLGEIPNLLEVAGGVFIMAGVSLSVLENKGEV